MKKEVALKKIEYLSNRYDSIYDVTIILNKQKWHGYNYVPKVCNENTRSRTSKSPKLTIWSPKH